MLVANLISENRPKPNSVAAAVPNDTWVLRFCECFLFLLPLFAQTWGPTETILVRFHSFWSCVNICMNTVVCNTVGGASVLGCPCSANIGASIDIKQVSYSVSCNVTV